MTKFPFSLRVLGRLTAAVLFYQLSNRPVVAQYVPVFTFTNLWRYNDKGPRDLGVAWREKGYNDSWWSQGKGAFAVAESNPGLTNLIRTTLAPRGTNGSTTISFYFRTQFVMPTNLPAYELVLSNLIDDGAVFYLNGVEVSRLRMPTSTIGPTTVASVSSTEGTYDTLFFDTTACVEGTNQLAVEVHQNLTAPLDMFFGMTLSLRTAEPIRIVTQPKSSFFFEGVPQTFSVEVAGAVPYFFQWYKGGLPISGATSANYTISNPVFTNQGVYSVLCSNLFSSIESTNVNYKPLGTLPSVTVQPATNSLVFDGDGLPLALSIDLVGTKPVWFQWYRNGIPVNSALNPTATNQTLIFSPPRTTDAGAYRVVVTNRVGKATSAVANVTVRVPITVAGGIDLSFHGSVPPIFRIATDNSDRILVGGQATLSSLGPVPPIARLLADGSRDTTFAPVVSNSISYVYSILVQPDDKILVGGDPKAGKGGITRLLPDGSADPTFNPGTGTDGRVVAIALQPDGKIVIGGQFSRFNGLVRNNFTRLNPDGSLDTSFITGSGFDFVVNSLLVRTNSRILVGGSFAKYNGTNRGSLVQIRSDGSWDPSFAISGGTLQGTIYEVKPSANGSNFLIGGSFSAVYGGVTNRYLAKLGLNGAFDSSLLVGRALGNGSIQAFVEQPADGRIVLLGSFSWTNSRGQQVSGLARVLGNGALDYGFDPGVGLSPPGAWSAVVQSNGRIVLAGPTGFDGVPRPNIVRLIDALPAPLNLTITPRHTLVLSWPFTSSTESFVLQSKRGDADTPWSDISVNPTFAANRYWVTNPISADHELFRLVRRR